MIELDMVQTKSIVWTTKSNDSKLSWFSPPWMIKLKPITESILWTIELKYGTNNMAIWKCAGSNLILKQTAFNTGHSHLSLRIGLRLYGMALDPIWSVSKGSSSSFWLARRRMSVQILWTDAPRLLRAHSTSKSTFRLYVWPVTIKELTGKMWNCTS